MPMSPMRWRDFDLDDWRVSDRDPLKVAGIAAAVLLVLVLLGLNLTRLPLLNSKDDYSAYLTSASGLTGGETVQVRGVRVGEVTGIVLEDDLVRVDFKVNGDVDLGEETSARVKVLNPLGAQFLALEPAGPGRLSEPIPVERTFASRTLVNELGRVSGQLDQTDIPQLQQALDVLTETLSASSSDAVAMALTGLNDFAGNLAEDADKISELVSSGSELIAIINDRSDVIVNLVSQGDALAAVLNERRDAIGRLVRGTADLSAQIAKILSVNRDKLGPMLRNLEEISQALATENESLGKAIPAMEQLSKNIARVTGTGRFVDIVVPNGLIPDAVIQQCADAGAFPAPNDPRVGCRP
jgi:phospholipid/cholesterol/gamma-HCH transport system substrate-binding protein